jgi:butyryl-CoA dehydrogenase
MDFDPTPDQEAFRRAAKRFVDEVVAPQATAIDERAVFPRDVIAEAGRRGLMGITIPAEWGGAGRDYVSYALAIEAIATASATVAVILAVNNSLVAEPIAAFGSDDQKERWLRPLASGAAIGAFALSEENAGTDAANQETVALLDERGYVLRGRKVWVANAEAADVMLVFAATQPGVRGRGVSAFLVPMDAPGVRRLGAPDSLGVRGLGCHDLALDGVLVDADALLGRTGDGFRMALWALEGGRVAIAAQAVGVGDAALEEALAHAKARHTFGQPIANYQAIQWMLADTATELDAARMLTLRAASAKDTRDRRLVEAAMAKLLASESAHRAADRALQILASRGYQRGSRVERLFRDARATEIYQGTSEVQRMIIGEAVTGT